MKGAWAMGLGLWALGLVGCSADEQTAEKRAELSQMLEQGVDPGETVATVEGRPISAASLATRVGRVTDGRSKQDVLDELILAEALYKEALAKGYGDSDEIQQVRKQAMVQRLLAREVERRALPSDVPMEEVKAYYKANELEFYYTPELRSADHLLVMPTSKQWDIRRDMDKIPKEVFDECEALSEQIHADIVENKLPAKNADQLKAIRDRWKAKAPENVEIDVESLPPFPKREAGKMGEPGFIPTVVEPFADAVFGMKPGGLSQPTRTIFGTHIATTTGIVEEQRITLEEATPGIREHLSNQKRGVLAKALMERLLGEYGDRVALDPSQVAKLTRKQQEGSP